MTDASSIGFAVASGAGVISVLSPRALMAIGFMPRAIAQHGNRN
jgi:hypothetical protein